MMLFEELTDEDNLAAGLQKMQEKDSERAYQQLREKLPFVRERKKWTIWPYAVAACLLLVAVSLYLFKSPARPAPATAAVARVEEDILPGGNKAVLTLADGQQLVLENQQRGNLQHEGAAVIAKLDSGQIAYQGTATQSGPALLNTLTTPKGGQYSVALSDGTKVWLNAGSSLRFSVVFTLIVLLERTSITYRKKFIVAH